MKNLLVILSLVLSANAANASNSNVKFVGVDNTTETNLCVMAAKNGYKAAVKEIKKTKDIIALGTTCNGQSIRSFSETYQLKPVSIESNVDKTVIIKPANESIESQVCAQAVKTGIKSVATTVNFDVRKMVCNGQNISRFVKRYNNS